MMHGTPNPDRICRLLEQIFSARDESINVKVTVAGRDNKETKNSPKEKTA